MDIEPAPDNTPGDVNNGKHLLGRRRLLEAGFWTSASVVGLTIAGTGTRFVAGDAFIPDEAVWVAVGEVATLAPGQMQKAIYRARGKDAWRTTERAGVLYVLSDGSGEFQVIDATCTHLGCNVHWNEACGCFRCPCHDAEFAADGSVVSGPPSQPLSLRQAKVENNILYVLL